MKTTPARFLTGLALPGPGRPNAAAKAGQPARLHHWGPTAGW